MGSVKLKVKYNWKTIGILGVLIGITCLISMHSYVFGNELFVFQDIGSDTFDQYINQYSTIIHHILDGNWSLWDFNNGLGTNMYMLNMFNPFLIIIYLLGAIKGIDHLTFYLIYVYILEILCAGIACYLFLSCFRLRERTKAVAAYIYAFNGFMVIWGQHYQFGVVVVLLPLLLLMAERCIRERKRWVGLTLVTFICVMNSMYMAYMSLLATGFYVVIRFWQLAKKEDKFADYIRNVMCVAGWMILGVALAAINLLPSAAAIFGASSRLENDISLIERLIEAFKPYSPLYYQTLGLGFITSVPQRILKEVPYYMNLYEDPQVWFSILFLPMSIQYIWMIGKQNTTKKQKGIAYLCVGVVLACLLCPVVSLVFNGFTVPFSRHTYLLMPFFAVMVAFVLEKNFAYLEQRIKTIQIRKMIYVGFILFLMVNVMANVSMGMYKRETLKKDSAAYFGTMFDDSVQEALTYLEETDSSFYRVEKDYSITTCMDSNVQGYHSTSTYNSTINGNFATFVEKIWPNLRWKDQNHFRYTQAIQNQMQSSLVSVKYLLSRESNLNYEGWELYKQCGSIYIYKNQYATALAAFYDKTTTSKVFESSVNLNKEALLGNIAVVEEENQFTVSQDQVDAYDIGGDKYAETFQGFSNESTVAVDATNKDSVLTGHGSVGKDGILMFSIPYENGWEVYLNGKKQELIKVNYGFLGVAVERGEYDVRIEYHCPLFTTGMWISILSFLIFLGMLMKTKKRK